MDITLSAASRANLLSLQQTAELIGRTQGRLSTGLKVASPIDDASKYFQAKGLTDRAFDFDVAKDNVDQALQAVKAGINGLEAATEVVEQMKGLAQKAQATEDAASRSVYARQFDDLRTQLDSLLGDATYKGKNLVNSGTETLAINFDEDSTADLTITASDNTATGLAINAAVTNWVNDTDITTAVNQTVAALNTLRANSETLGSNAALLQIRSDFTANYINTLNSGAGMLTLADTNEEGANLSALQTRQQLGVVSLSIATQAEQAILRLF